MISADTEIEEDVDCVAVIADVMLGDALEDAAAVLDGGGEEEGVTDKIPVTDTAGDNELTALDELDALNVREERGVDEPAAPVKVPASVFVGEPPAVGVKTELAEAEIDGVLDAAMDGVFCGVADMVWQDVGVSSIEVREDAVVPSDAVMEFSGDRDAAPDADTETDGTEVEESVARAIAVTVSERNAVLVPH